MAFLDFLNFNLPISPHKAFFILSLFLFNLIFIKSINITTIDDIRPNNIVAQYLFNGNANDDGPNKLHGTVMGGASPTYDRFGNANSAYSFDCSGYIIIDPFSSFPEKEISVSSWFSTVNGDDYSTISYYTNSNNNYFVICPNRQEKFGVQIMDYYRAFNGYSIHDGVYHHFMVTWKSLSGSFNVYVDSVLSQEGVSVGNGRTLENNGVLVFAQDQDCHGGCFESSQCLDGELDDIIIWDVALTKEEVRKVYQLGLISNGYSGRTQDRSLSDNLVVKYLFNGNANDDGANSLHGVVNNVQLVEDRFGTPESAYKFTAVSGSNYQTITINPFNVFPTTEITVSLWMKNTERSNSHAGIAISYATSSMDNSFTLRGGSIEVFSLLLLSHTVIYSDKVIPYDEYHHVVITWRSDTGIWSLFVNGVLEHTARTQNGNSFGSSGSLVFGNDQDCVGGCFNSNEAYIGVLDDVMIWNVVLSDDEIEELYTLGQCKDGYVNFECSPTCFGVSEPPSQACSQHGSCVSTDNCECESGYEGNNCQLWYCNDVLYNVSCSTPNGTCLVPNSCTCESGYEGDNCNNWRCNGLLNTNVNSCSGENGTCTSPNNCLCQSDYEGSNCENWRCSEIVQNDENVCSSNGACVSPDLCVCDTEFYGENCEFVNCYGVKNTNNSVCSSNGVCSGHNECTCNDGYLGIECSYWGCFGIEHNSSNVCSGHGTCSNPNDCTCNIGYGIINNECRPLCDGKSSFPLLYDNFENKEVSLSLWTNDFQNNIVSSSICGSHAGNAYVFNSETERTLTSNTIESNSNNRVIISFWIVLGSVDHLHCEGISLNKDMDVYVYSIEDSVKVLLKNFKPDFNDGKPFNVTLEYFTTSGTFQLQFVQNNFIFSFDNWAIDEVSVHNNMCNYPNGVCTSPEKCSCSIGAYSATCEIISCFGILSNDTENDACNGNGKCQQLDKCYCEELYYGDECQFWDCFGVSKNSNKVCSKN